LVYSRKIDEN
jgi:hypothetical protein